ncbi:hypothetical protein EN829_014455 [Mesorhizobium sp. M00.F.Ca.ET.186.01.1.1]|nr:hypothetical protein EN829_014455 [Mesorhizobium sp. M00.F.Ca.ET.186.01.1.1]TIW60971.1 MAG: hypothetical protein E5V48_11450 [Mesorhizobium sp.]
MCFRFDGYACVLATYRPEDCWERLPAENPSPLRLNALSNEVALGTLTAHLKMTQPTTKQIALSA